jgi:hypothetical protein
MGPLFNERPASKGSPLWQRFGLYALYLSAVLLMASIGVPYLLESIHERFELALSKPVPDEIGVCTWDYGLCPKDKGPGKSR